MVIFSILGIVCLLYFFIICIYSGRRETFSGFWFVAGAACWLIAVLARWAKNANVALWPFPGAVFALAAAAVGLLFLWVELRILAAALKKPADNARTVIILGAQVWGRTPSRSLRRRVKAGADYLKRNPGAKVIVSGGQGPGEEMTEAACMKELLMALGIDKSRILTEEKSTDTYENIHFSLALCNPAEELAVVTCGYHMYRALAIARKAGAQNVCGCPAKSSPWLRVNYYVREFFAVLKYKAGGRI